MPSNSELSRLAIASLIPVIAAAFLSLAGCRTPKQALVAPEPDPPCKINVVVDTSASMQGYFNGSTEFKDTIAHLAAALDNYTKEAPSTKSKCVKKVAFQFANDSGSLFTTNDTASSFIDRLLKNDLALGQGSLLQEMLRSAAEESSGASISPTQNTDPTKNSPALSILITDSIFSYPDAVIRQNPEANREDIEGLASKVKITFHEAQNSGKSTSLLAFRSQFHGTYYNYRNGKMNLGSVSRPYYMWLIGSPANIGVIRQLLQRQGVIPDHAVDFSTEQIELSPLILQYSLLNKYDRRTNTGSTFHRHDRGGRESIRVTKPDDGSGEVQFSVGFDFSKLPPDQQDVDFLKKHMKIQSSSPELQVKNMTVQMRSDVESKLDKNDRDNIAKKETDEHWKCTHVVNIKTDARFRRATDLVIEIENDIPGWYQDWSNEDDTHEDSKTARSTYGLTHFINAIHQSYKRSGPIGQATLTLER